MDAFAIVGHLVLLALVVAIIAPLFLPRRGNPAAWRDLWYWLAMPVPPLLVLILLRGQVRNEALIFAYGLILFTSFVALLGTIFTIIRVLRHLDGTRPGVVLLWATCLTMLVAILMPGVPQAREAARRTQCRYNLKYIGIALYNYHDEYGSLPPAILATNDTEVSWRVLMLPYLDQAALYKRYDQGTPWNAGVNQPVSRTPVPEYLCPSIPHAIKPSADQYAPTDYAALVGDETAFPSGRTVTFNEIADGTSHTLLIVEAAQMGIRWAEPKDIDVPFASEKVRGQRKGGGPLNPLLSSEHAGGAHALLADGSVRFISENIDPEILRGMTTRAGGEPAAEL